MRQSQNAGILQALKEGAKGDMKMLVYWVAAGVLTFSVTWMKKMIMNLGLPYKGSKNTIANDIVKALPRGKKLLDEGKQIDIFEGVA